ncbi:hypothetical protein NDU88_001522 [Pleurodeles waltl]|uniref:Uncharacterized protein n=1 Tax=Pleurodeles waltl TaxID=8319 RepID=A0AAV7U9L4_PLEWA|nr:hypothetical protein NDU88_001522 [Pleurodeles waltl]
MRRRRQGTDFIFLPLVKSTARVDIIDVLIEAIFTSYCEKRNRFPHKFYFMFGFAWHCSSNTCLGVVCLLSGLFCKFIPTLQDIFILPEAQHELCELLSCGRYADCSQRFLACLGGARIHSAEPVPSGCKMLSRRELTSQEGNTNVNHMPRKCHSRVFSSRNREMAMRAAGMRE